VSRSRRNSLLGLAMQHAGRSFTAPEPAAGTWPDHGHASGSGEAAGLPRELGGSSGSRACHQQAQQAPPPPPQQQLQTPFQCPAALLLPQPAAAAADPATLPPRTLPCPPAPAAPRSRRRSMLGEPQRSTSSQAADRALHSQMDAAAERQLRRTTSATMVRACRCASSPASRPHHAPGHCAPSHAPSALAAGAACLQQVCREGRGGAQPTVACWGRR
jgi:hypothetical protein